MILGSHESDVGPTPEEISMRKKTIRLAGLFVAVALLLGLNLYAQQTNVGGITGTVRDASGAVIPEADVEAVNQATQVRQKAVTNRSGIYTIPLLQIGNYTVTVSKAGFQKSVRAISRCCQV